VTMDLMGKFSVSVVVWDYRIVTDTTIDNLAAYSPALSEFDWTFIQRL
jgi:hypothetical protein